MTLRKGPEAPWPNDKDFYRLTARIADALERIADELEAQRAIREEASTAPQTAADPAAAPAAQPSADVSVELGPPNTQPPLRTSYPPGSAAEALEGLKRLRTLQAMATGAEEGDVFTDNPFAPRFGKVPREVT